MRWTVNDLPPRLSSLRVLLLAVCVLLFGERNAALFAQTFRPVTLQETLALFMCPAIPCAAAVTGAEIGFEACETALQPRWGGCIGPRPSGRLR